MRFLSSLFDRVRKIFAWKDTSPLVTYKKDLQLVRRLRGRTWPSFLQWTHIGIILPPAERRIFQASFLVGLVALLWLVVLGVGYAMDQAPRVGGEYVEAVIGSPELVNPVFASVNDVDQDITRLVFSGLMQYDKDQRLVPDLAVNYSVSDDKKTYTFTLRKDVVWHGEPVMPFTANDVVFTFDMIQNPVVNSPLRATFEGVEVKALDEHTIQFTLPEVFAPFLSSLTVGIIPEHVWSEVPPENMRLRKENLQPVGTGPFAFEGYTKDEGGFIIKYTLKRFDRYYQQIPYIDSFSFRFFAEYDNRSGAIVALKEGKVDGLQFVPYEFRQAVERKHIDLHTLQLPQYTALFLNQGAQPILGDVSVRQALSLAVDKDRMVRDVLKNEGQTINGPVLPGYPGFSTEIGATTYSVDEANKLLDTTVWARVSAEEFRAARRQELLSAWETQLSETKTAAEAATSPSTDASSTEGNTPAPAAEPIDETALRLAAEQQIDEQLGQELHAAQTFYRKNKDGKLLELTITTVDTVQYKKAAELVAGFWQEIGVKVNLRFLTPKEIDREVLKQRAYDALLYGAIIGGDPDQYPLWHSSQATYPGLNLSGYKNRNVDALLEKARETTEEQELEKIYKEFQEYVAKDRPAVFLYMPTYTYATSDGVHGFDVDRIFTPSDRFANVIEWYIKTKPVLAH